MNTPQQLVISHDLVAVDPHGESCRVKCARCNMEFDLDREGITHNRCNPQVTADIRDIRNLDGTTESIFCGFK